MSASIFNRNMTSMAAAKMLDHLIRHEWRTETEVTADASGCISFRGFKGRYELSWGDASGPRYVQETVLK